MGETPKPPNDDRPTEKPESSGKLIARPSTPDDRAAATTFTEKYLISGRAGFRPTGRKSFDLGKRQIIGTVFTKEGSPDEYIIVAGLTVIITRGGARAVETNITDDDIASLFKGPGDNPSPGVK